MLPVVTLVFLPFFVWTRFVSDASHPVGQTNPRDDEPCLPSRTNSPRSATAAFAGCSARERSCAASSIFGAPRGRGHLDQDSTASGTVRATDSEPYPVTVELTPAGIRSSCSCPAFQKGGQHCKHVAALLISVRDQGVRESTAARPTDAGGLAADGARRRRSFEARSSTRPARTPERSATDGRPVELDGDGLAGLAGEFRYRPAAGRDGAADGHRRVAPARGSDRRAPRRVQAPRPPGRPHRDRARRGGPRTHPALGCARVAVALSDAGPRRAPAARALREREPASPRGRRSR